ncbi:MAG TPA: hypothetical protein VMS21_06055, partial [Methylomirabilota bacterium]|nr:hypothetical protein [Methylomirabilota bacterium]
MKRPFVPILILYVTGLVIADCFPVSLPPLYALSFLIAISCLLSRDWRPWLVPPLIVLVGWTHLASHSAI